MYQLLNHQRKEKLRSPFWTKNILMNILLGFLGLYLIVTALVVSFMAAGFIREEFEGRDVIEVFTAFLFYFFIFDLGFRFLLQQLPTLSLQPYLTLPVTKSKLIHYPLLRSISSFFNILPVILVLPFFIMIVCANQTGLYSTIWIATVFSVIITNNFLNFILKKYFVKRPVLILAIFLVAGCLLYFDSIGNAPLSGYFAAAVNAIANLPFLFMIPLIIAALTYYFAYHLLRKNFYPEDSQTTRSRPESYSFLNKYGELGELIGIELKMILRNKRPMSVLIFSILFLAYGFILYDDPDNHFNLMLGGFIMTAAFAVNYGQFLFSWEGSYFDSFMVNRVSSFNYIKTKYILIAFSGFMTFVITLPYAFISYRIGFVNAAMLLFNIGISSVLLLLFSTRNSTSIVLEKSQFLNYQGTGAMQFLMIIPLLGIPLITYIVFLILGIQQYAVFALGAVGFVGIIFYRPLLQIVVNSFVKRKYVMSSNFRKK